MSEADIIERMFDAIQTVLTIFSIFFTLVSAYIAGLYLFLKTAPLLLRLVAFALLSVGLVFLGGTAAVVQRLQDGLFVAWTRLSSPLLDLKDMRNPLPIGSIAMAGINQQDIGVGVGWAVAVTVYLVLAYLTFLYRWPERNL
ncbi:MAG: hypothetical protein AB7O43_15680 [Hyphomicrobiaceae bacterium]